MEKMTEQRLYDVYMKSILNKKVSLLIQEIGGSTKKNLEKKIAGLIEGQCIREGFIKPGSVKIVTYSSANISNMNNEFQVVFECMVCHPVEGMLIEAIAKTITKAGIHAEVIDKHGVTPITLFIARDHHNTDKYFHSVKEGDKILTRVIGIRFELYDTCIYAIADLVNPKIK